MEKDFNNMPPFMDFSMFNPMSKHIAIINIYVCRWIIKLNVKNMKKCVIVVQVMRKYKEE